LEYICFTATWTLQDWSRLVKNQLRPELVKTSLVTAKDHKRPVCHGSVWFFAVSGIGRTGYSYGLKYWAPKDQTGLDSQTLQSLTTSHLHPHVAAADCIFSWDTPFRAHHGLSLLSHYPLPLLNLQWWQFKVVMPQTPDPHMLQVSCTLLSFATSGILQRRTACQQNTPFYVHSSASIKDWSLVAPFNPGCQVCTVGTSYIMHHGMEMMTGSSLLVYPQTKRYQPQAGSQVTNLYWAPTSSLSCSWPIKSIPCSHLGCCSSCFLGLLLTRWDHHHRCYHIWSEVPCTSLCYVCHTSPSFNPSNVFSTLLFIHSKMVHALWASEFLGLRPPRNLAALWSSQHKQTLYYALSQPLKITSPSIHLLI